jgi:hypothetical protein
MAALLSLAFAPVLVSLKSGQFSRYSDSYGLDGRDSNPGRSKIFFSLIHSLRESWDSAVGIATGYRLNNRGVGVRASVGEEFSFLYVVQTSSVAHPESYSMGSEGPFLESKAVGG